MIYFLVDAGPAVPRVKIGYSANAETLVSRIRSHWSTNGDLRFYCAIDGDRDREQALHGHLAASRANDRNRETFTLTPALQDYLEWLGEQPWSACSLEEVIDPWAHWPVEVMWPWQSYRANTTPPTRLELFTEHFGPVRGPLSAEERGSAVHRDTNDWYTPMFIVQSATRVMGHIDLDPATSWAANKNIRAASIYTKNDDGLAPSNPWAGNVWLNPPYGGQQAKFIRRAVTEWQTGNVDQVIACVNSNCTDTRWFQLLWPVPVCFTVGRIPYNGGPGLGENAKTETNNQPANGTAFAYFGPNRQTFVDEFTKYGNVVLDVARYRGTILPLDDEGEAA